MRWTIGIDEAGRGPLAGPVTVGAVLAPTGYKFQPEVKDSKQLRPEKRLVQFKILKSDPRIFCVSSSVSHKIIDEKGIMHAVRLAISRCLNQFDLRNKKVKVLLDGAIYAPEEFEQETIIKGDEKIPIISAASIIAKVTRDKKMTQLAKKYPKYNFEINKGYGTFRHRDVLKKIGLCEIHRKTYCTRIV